MKLRKLRLRLFYLWPVFSIIASEILRLLDTQYDESAFATLIFISGPLWGFPIIASSFLLKQFGSNSIVAEYVVAALLFVVVIELIVFVQRRKVK